MIYIFSSEIDYATSCVIDWLGHFNKKHIRITNLLDLKYIFCIYLDRGEEGKRNYKVNNIEQNSVWNRKLEKFLEIDNKIIREYYKNVEELIEAIKKESNQKHWHVSKDKCDVCKDCEFRYMCMDKRIPHQRRNGGWYHKEECNYNPYIGKWKGEEGYKTLNEIGVISNEDWFFIDYNKVEQINQKLV